MPSKVVSVHRRSNSMHWFHGRQSRLRGPTIGASEQRAVTGQRELRSAHLSRCFFDDYFSFVRSFVRFVSFVPSFLRSFVPSSLVCDIHQTPEGC